MTTIPKTALVTGGSQRVGKAIVEGLADAGYAVAIHYNRSAEQRTSWHKPFKPMARQR